MGNNFACCGQDVEDEKIAKCEKFEELTKIFKEKKEECPKQRKEINDFLNGKTDKVESINIEGLTNEMLKERVKYLSELETTYNKVANDLKRADPKKIKLNEIKPLLHDIATKYYLTNDPNHQLDLAYTKFANYMQHALKEEEQKQ